MTDDIIRKATTADYIETIDNLRAEVERLRSTLVNLKAHNYVNAFPDGGYAMRILQSYREMCDQYVSDDITGGPTNPVYIAMNEANEKRKIELDKAISDLAGIAAKDARIKELEAAVVDGRAQYLLLLDCNQDCTAWNFDELDETEQDALREQAQYMLEMEEPWVYVQLREAREQIKRLEAAFLKAEKANLMHHMDADYADENAREALERIKAETGSGDHVAGANKLILTAEQREEEGKRDA